MKTLTDEEVLNLVIKMYKRSKKQGGKTHLDFIDHLSAAVTTVGGGVRSPAAEVPVIYLEEGVSSSEVLVDFEGLSA